MKKQYAGADRALTYLFENANEVEIQRILTTGTLSAIISIDGTDYNLYSDSGDEVIYNQIQQSGTKIAQISINGSITDIYAPTAGGATQLTGLSDVSVSSLADGQILKYDATNQEWVNANEGGAGSSTLAGLTDVNLTTPTNGQVLTYDATDDEWVNADTLQTNISSPANGQVLKYNAISGKWENANESGGSVIDYSTTEQNTGKKWVDGKTIYQKSVNIGKILSTGTNVYTLGITGVDSIIDYSIIPMQRANSDVYNVDNGDVTWNQGSYFVRYIQNDASVGLKIAVYSGNYLSQSDIYVTVWYTKT